MGMNRRKYVLPLVLIMTVVGGLAGLVVSHLTSAPDGGPHSCPMGATGMYACTYPPDEGSWRTTLTIVGSALGLGLAILAVVVIAYATKTSRTHRQLPTRVRL